MSIRTNVKCEGMLIGNVMDHLVISYKGDIIIILWNTVNGIFPALSYSGDNFRPKITGVDDV